MMKTFRLTRGWKKVTSKDFYRVYSRNLKNHVSPFFTSAEIPTSKLDNTYFIEHHFHFSIPFQFGLFFYSEENFSDIEQKSCEP